MSDRRRLMALRELHVPTPMPQHDRFSFECVENTRNLKWMRSCPACRGTVRLCVECRQPWPCQTKQVLDSPDDEPVPAPGRDDAAWPDLR